MLRYVLLLQIRPPVDIFALAYYNPVIDAISYGYKTENTFPNLSTKLIHFRTHSNGSTLNRVGFSKFAKKLPRYARKFF